MKRIELLAPAGSFEALKAAVNCGADAVYLGGSSFSARAFANNFNHEEMIEAVNYCHLRGVKVYVTMNTLLSEKELDNAMEEVKFLYEHNVDALIIQDLGLYYRISTEYPDFEINASTQMHVHNIEGVKAAKKLGFKKVVIARESSLETIKEACKEDIEIECFVHGAICVAYSGQCLMSAVTKNRSANKGMCAQCCRLKYELFDKTTNKSIDTDTEYLLSPKDMFLLEDIPSLIDAGVSSLKIEGRMKSSAYVGLVTSIYRKAIDAHYKGEKFILNKQEYEDLLSVFNRGFTNSYLLNNKASIFGNIRPNHMGKEVGVVTSYRNGHAFIKVNKEVNQFDGIRIINKKKDTGKILNTITIDGKYVNKAGIGQVIELNVDTPVERGDKVVRTLDYKLEELINSYSLKKRDIKLDLVFIENKPVIITASIGDLKFKKVYEIRPQKALKAPVDEEMLLNQFKKTDDSPFNVLKGHFVIGNAFMAKSQINELRRTFLNDFEDFVLNSFEREYYSYPLLEDVKTECFEETLIVNNSDLAIENSLDKNETVNLSGEYKSSCVSELGNLFNEGDKTAFYTLNVSNSYAYELLLKLGFKKIVLSTELNQMMIDDLISAYKERNDIDIKPYVFVYGRRTLMYLNRNPFAEYINNEDEYLLKDYLNTYLLDFKTDISKIREYLPVLREDIDLSKINPLVIIDDSNDLSVVENKLHLKINVK
ncbi:MAG: DUF3656 domain-containing protein [Erysipelotrichaceae bacterium]|nr:DUF3656 domain-containing protein [Erysipelotrichaceae bacterium]